MAEQTATQPVFYTKDFGTFGNPENNFVTNQELTVTITLNEYRDLVKQTALADKKIREAESEKYDAQRDVKHLSEENSNLKSEIYKLQKQNAEKSSDNLADELLEPMNYDELLEPMNY